MDKVIYSARLKLTLITKAEPGSQEFDWIHELRSDKNATWYSVYGQSKTEQDTLQQIQRMGLAPGPASTTTTTQQANAKTYKVNYAVHAYPTPLKPDAAMQENQETKFIGMLTLGPRPLLDLPINLFPPESSPPSALAVEIGYSFVTSSWGHGYATEALTALLNACRTEKAKQGGFWDPYEKVYVRAIVNVENPASRKVLGKSGVPELGTVWWEGEKVWLMGEWRERAELVVFGRWLD